MAQQHHGKIRLVNGFLHKKCVSIRNIYQAIFHFPRQDWTTSQSSRAQDFSESLAYQECQTLSEKVSLWNGSSHCCSLQLRFARALEAKSHGHADESSSDNGDEQAESVHGSSDGHLPPAQEQVEGDSVACPADDDVKMVEAAESDDELDATTLPGPGDVASLADDDEEMPPLTHPSPERDQANEEADEESSSSHGGYDCFFESPECGNSGPPRNELIEMCLGLMQYLSQEHPDIMKCLGGRCECSCDRRTRVVKCCARCHPSRHFHMVNYMDHCEWSFSRFGIRATSWLSTKEHFARWLKRFNELNRTSDCNKARCIYQIACTCFECLYIYIYTFFKYKPCK